MSNRKNVWKQELKAVLKDKIMKEDEATVFLLEILRDEYQFKEIQIEKYYFLIKEEKTARMLLLLIINLKTRLLSFPDSNEVIKGGVTDALLILNINPNYEYEELWGLVALKSII